MEKERERELERFRSSAVNETTTTRRLTTFGTDNGANVQRGSERASTPRG